MAFWKRSIALNKQEESRTNLVDSQSNVITEKIEEERCFTQKIIEGNNKIRVGFAQNIGSREVQQDAIRTDDDYAYADSQKMISILCDGMGGLAGGEIASKLCADTLYNAFYSVGVDDDVSSFYEFVIREMDKDISNLKDSSGMSVKAGTTLISVIIMKNKLYLASVGDSRIYFLRNNEIKCLTVDHNYKMILDHKVKNGLITEKQAQTDPQKEALVSFLGIGDLKYIDINQKPIDLNNGDYIVLCSDGLYRTLNEEEILKTLTYYRDDMQSAAEVLVNNAIAKKKKHQDNVSVIAIKFLDSG